MTCHTANGRRVLTLAAAVATADGDVDRTDRLMPLNAAFLPLHSSHRVTRLAFGEAADALSQLMRRYRMWVVSGE